MSERQVVTAFDRLLMDLSGKLTPYPYSARRWQEISANQSTMVEVRNPKSGIALALALAERQIGNWSTYQRCKAACVRDAVFKDAPRLAGYWGTFEQVFRDTATHAANVRGGKIIFDSAKGRARIRELRRHFQSGSFRYECRASILGADLTVKRAFLPDGVELYRLSRKERNERQPTVEPYVAAPGMTGWGSPPRIEARYHQTVAVDRHADHAFFKAGWEALEKASAVFGRVVDAITAAHKGRFDHGPIELLGGFDQGGRPLRDARPFFAQKLSLTSCRKASTFYSLLRDPAGDRVLNRGLRRLVLGRKRADAIDRLVDLVIGWEAVLLTQNGHAITQELTYRFSLNSALIVNRARPRLAPPALVRQFKGAYAARSSIVHGDNDKALTKALRSGGFPSLTAACDFLEGHLRHIILSLNEMPAHSRPYRAKGGWDRLLWR